MHDPEDATLDLEPIMVGSNEVQDPLLAALLESEVGLHAEGWDAQAALTRCGAPVLPSPSPLLPVPVCLSSFSRHARLCKANRIAAFPYRGSA